MRPLNRKFWKLKGENQMGRTENFGKKIAKIWI